MPTTQSYLGNTSTLTWSSLAGGAFSALEVLTLTNTGGPSGNILATMSLTNTGNLPLSLFLFHMLDMDLQPTASNDTASLAGPNLIRLTDAGTNAAFYQGIGANAWLVRPFGATDIGAVMPDGAETNFNNSGLPFGPNDFTAGFQWNLLIDPGQTLQAQVLVGVNDPLPASDVPEPASFALLAAGLLGMKLFRRWQS
ncbi:MAG: PEP-CTERM sorting domain-containing protein [Bryobacterales bacterium]|nr:PEP-CTERM sorting domain-containing protein [Bryobacterales bacterium]